MVNAPETMIAPSGGPAALKNSGSPAGSDGGVDHPASAIGRIADQLLDLLAGQLADHLPRHPIQNLVDKAVTTDRLDRQTIASGVGFGLYVSAVCSVWLKSMSAAVW